MNSIHILYSHLNVIMSEMGIGESSTAAAGSSAYPYVDSNESFDLATLSAKILNSPNNRKCPSTTTTTTISATYQRTEEKFQLWASRNRLGKKGPPQL